MHDLISIIIPVYNTESYLRRCIDSVLAQTYSNLEIILVNDGSTDSSLEICEQYAMQDCRIRVLQQNNQGAFRARARGVEESQGNFIGFVDSDDWIEPCMYSELYQRIMETGADVVESGLFRMLKGKAEVPLQPATSQQVVFLNDLLRGCMTENLLLGNLSRIDILNGAFYTKLIRKSIVKRAFSCISTNILMGEDILFNLYLIQLCRSIAFSQQCYYHYEKRLGSLTMREDILAYIGEYTDTLHAIHQFLDRYRYGDSYKRMAFYMIFRLLHMNANQILGNSDKRYPLYQYPSIASLTGKSIVLYGAGEVGMDYFRRFYTDKTIQVLCWVDKNYKQIHNPLCEIEAPENICRYQYDYLLIAVRHQSAAQAIQSELIALGVPEQKILWQKPESTLDWLYQ